MPLKYIYHLSDLHIRKDEDKIECRYEEYKSVFNNTIISIKDSIKEHKLEFNDYIIVITGDIFHNKTNIGNYGLLLYKTFIQELTKVSRVYILHGNHDLNQSELNHPSLVYSSTFDIVNLVILNKTQSFIIDNIGFSYVSIEETLDNYKNSGRVQDLPSFPIINGEVKYKIALFHGSFASARLYNGTEIKPEYKPYPLEWVQDFDYVLLGDIHKRQIFTYKKKTICGYSGSLIQQDYGEDIVEHGYLLWNLDDKKITEINVYNSIGRINIKQNDKDEILIRKNGKYEKLLENEIKDNLDYFPKELFIRYHSKINFDNLNKLLKTYDIIFTKNKEEKLLNLDIINKYDIDDDILNTEELDNIIDNDYILEYFKKILTPEKYNKLFEIIKSKEKLLFDVEKYPEDLVKECITKNKELSKIITECNKNTNIKELKKPFTIRYLEWEGLLCYENKNWLNIHELDNKTFMIKGKNGTGKSAIYDILLLAIWGENTKKNNLSSGYINYNKTAGYTIIDIELDGKLYRIQRDFIIRKNTNKLHISHISMYKFINDKDLDILFKEAAANNLINKLFGTMNDFISSSMITQNVDKDILKLQPKEILKIIDKSFNIETIYYLYDLFKQSLNKYKDFRKTVHSKKEVYEKLVSNCKIEVIDDEEIEKLKEELILKTNEKEELELLFDRNIIDIKNPKNLIILETDYIKLINSLDKDKLISKENYNIYKEKYNELKLLLKCLSEKEILLLKESYNNEIETKIKYLTVKTKPCELSVIENERKQLIKYLEKNDEKELKKSNDITKELEELLNLLKDEYLKIKEQEKELVSSKPLKIDNCSLNKEEVLKYITKEFNSLENLKLYIFKNKNLKINLESIDSKNNFSKKEILLIDYDTYIIIKNRYDELQFTLKDLDLTLYQSYDPENEENKLKTMLIKTKPCELSVIENERIQLLSYLDDFNLKKENENKNEENNNYEIKLKELEQSLSLLKEEYLMTEEKKKELISSKPLKIDKCILNKEELINDILKLFNTIDEFNEFIKSNKNEIDKKLKTKIINSLTYDEYKKQIEKKNRLEEIITINKNKLLLLDQDFEKNYKKQQTIIIKNKPLEEPKFSDNNEKKSKKEKKEIKQLDITKELKLINIKELLKQIEKDEKEIEKYSLIFENIDNLQNELNKYKNELQLLTTNEEYKYNPECKYCCIRPWVLKIKELEKQIKKLDKEILEQCCLLENENYDKLIINNEKDKKTKINYYLLLEWQEYLKSKDSYDKITKELNKILKDKNELNKIIIDTNELILKINNDIDNFNIYSYLKNEEFNLIDNYESYKKWEDNYNNIIKKSIELENEIKNKEEEINYNKNIKPRIIKYLELKDSYDKWNEYDNCLKKSQIYELNKLKEQIGYYEYYNYYSYLKYNELNIIETYETYKKWEDSHNEIIKKIDELENEIKIKEEEINYNKNIKPRIIKYLELKDSYDKWNEYDKYLKIININELFKLKELLDIYDKWNDYTLNENNKPLIKEKIELNNLINSKKTEIKQLNDKIIKLTTINNYNNENKDNYIKLFDINTDIDNIIDILETIIQNFQAFRIEMYDKFILNKLTEKTNKIIKSLCHKDTKPFKLDYIITIDKDIIHINWLINNDISHCLPDLNVKQIISISQASGFQHFVISLALRMNLFMNKYENQCNQLFIDEGFINFDKDNLSIVPSIINDLLSYFKSIIIVSHIDLIQDKVDEIINIKYDKSTSVSHMTYNNCKKTIIKRKKKTQE